MGRERYPVITQSMITAGRGGSNGSLRLHKVQAMMNLRQVLEAGAAAAFAIANPDTHHFVEVDAFAKITDPTQKLTVKRYKWLKQNYSAKSEWIASTKDSINSSAVHANVISGDNTFRMAGDHAAVCAPFFDIEDEYFVKADLWLISSVAITPTIISFIALLGMSRAWVGP